MNPLLQRLRYHVTGAIERGEAEPIVEQRGYSAGRYYDQDTGRTRWAVVGPTDTWYFPTRYGRRAAHALACRLNKEAR